MPRITEVELRALMQGTADTTDVSLYIGQASMLVNEELGASGLTSERLKYIELNLAAHFAVVAIERGGFTYQRALSSEEGYSNDRRQVKLSSTRFGQQAVALDSTGNLASLDAPGGTAEFRVV